MASVNVPVDIRRLITSTWIRTTHRNCRRTWCTMSSKNLYDWRVSTIAICRISKDQKSANFNVSAIAPNSPTGYILEVDLEYPQYLHNRHTDLLFCPTCDKPPGKREDEFLATLYNKQHYIIHYWNLQQYHGLHVTRIHRVLQFAQSGFASTLNLIHSLELALKTISKKNYTN